MRRILNGRLSRRWLFLPPVMIGIGVVAALASSRRGLDRVQIEEEATPVYVIRAAKVSMSPEVIGYGTVAPRRRWTAVAEVGGRVSATADRLRSGIIVRDGQRLVEIERDDYQLRLQQRQADIDQAKAQLAELQLNEAADEASLEIQRDLLKVRQTELSRLRDLRGRSAASDTELDAARAADLQQQQKVQDLVNSIETYQTKVDSAKASLAMAESKRREAERDLDRTTINAPFDGVLADVELESGQYVAPGQSLFEIIDDSRVEISAQFSVDQLQQLMLQATSSGQSKQPGSAGQESSSGQREPSSESLSIPAESMATRFVGSGSDLLPSVEAEVIIQSGDLKQVYRGRPLRISSSIDESTRTLGVVIGVDNQNLVGGDARNNFARLRVGMYCKVNLRCTDPVSAFAFPRTAIDDGSVMILGEEDRILRRSVKAAFSNGDTVAIVDGVAPGEMIAVNPPEGLLDGQRVQPIVVSIPLMTSTRGIPFDGDRP
ncbi:MAG: efflux RND transporter periplasmic adaptor subunit [Planctomycetota bacterium]